MRANRKAARIALVAVVLAARTIAFGQAPPSQPALTLAQARAKALAQPSAYLDAEDNARSAEEDVKQARIGYLPVATAPLSYIYSSPARGPEFTDVPLTQRPPAFIANNAVNEYVLLTTVEGKIDINGGQRATLDRSRAELARARASALIAKRGLISAVADAYYGLAIARANRSVAEQTLKSATDFQAITQLLYEGGEVPELDALKARTDASTRADELEQAKATDRDAADTLNMLIGTGLEASIDVGDLGLALPDPAELTALTPDLVTNRPELAAIEAEERAADADARSARAERLPSLGYSVSAGIDDSTIHPSRDLGGSAAVTLTIPIFDWGAAKSRQRQAEIRRDAARRNRILAERQVRLEYANARNAAESAIARVRLTGAGIKDAERALEISELRYRAGEAPVLEVVDARTTLSEKRTAYYKAIFDYRIALDRLERAVGR